MDKRILWLKLYFWFCVFSYLCGDAFAIIGDTPFKMVFDIVDFLVGLVALTGLYGYMKNRNIFTSSFWKIFVFVYITWNLVEYGNAISTQWMDSTLAGNAVKVVSIIAIGTLIDVPLVVSLFRYAYKRTQEVKI